MCAAVGSRQRDRQADRQTVRQADRSVTPPYCDNSVVDESTDYGNSLSINMGLSSAVFDRCQQFVVWTQSAVSGI